jgi:hypothetical protein
MQRHYLQMHGSRYGYNGNPYLPWDYNDLNGNGNGYNHYPPVSYGGSPVEGLLRVLGGLGLGDVATQAGQDLFNTPEVQAKLETLQEECKIRAKEGVTEWMQENKGMLITAGAALIGLNYLMLTFAVLPVVRPRR